MGRVDKKIALVTGAAQGLGAAIATMLANEGAKVALSDIKIDGARDVANEINSEHPDSAIAIKQDVADEAGWQRVLQQIISELGGLNILVNNAGIGSIASVEDETYENWRRVHEVDLDSVFLACKYAVPLIAESGGGSIINISSISGIIAGHNLAAYNSAKAAVRHAAIRYIRCSSTRQSSMEWHRARTERLRWRNWGDKFRSAGSGNRMMLLTPSCTLHPMNQIS
jgi:NAD(P)-dependent dehydrogenase (short-subunit alcohol dehydrogenase family)